MDAASIIPQSAPMRLVGELLSVRENGEALVRGLVAPDCPFLRPDGRLTPAGLLEMAAQSCACLQGYRTATAAAAQPPREAFLVGMKNARFRQCAHADDPLFITVTPAAELDGFFLADAAINRGAPDGPLIASVRVKAYCPPQSGENSHAFV